jgi:hypothetical protein
MPTASTATTLDGSVAEDDILQHPNLDGPPSADTAAHEEPGQYCAWCYK